jgi:hypothetical protein
MSATYGGGGGSFHDWTFDTNGKFKKVRVPRSCIESTETIIRKHNDPGYRFTRGGLGSDASSPPIFLWLSNGVCVFATNVSDLESKDTFYAVANATNYDSLQDESKAFSLTLGQGIGIIRVSGKSLGYDMHFLAVVATYSNGDVELSDVSEPDHWNETSQEVLTTVRASSVRDLRATLGSPYTNTKDYAVGVVTIDGATPP